ncbi:MAG: glycosyltransferase [Chloroflexi bacterium]|nr:glycosyltransferase [Chloroflexota bacterium]
MNLLWEQYAYIVVLFLLLCIITAVSNHRAIRRFDEYPPADRYPKVSILVPARNEAGNISACLTSLLAQDYPDFEALVVDDHSTDGTRAIVARLAAKDKRLRLLHGESLPVGWLGKHWACHQLAAAASGELLLFTDADTQHAPDMLRHSVAALSAEGADLATALPREEVLTWGEKLIVPVIAWGILSFLPYRLANLLALPGLSVTIGQFMLFRREAFEAIGGYAAVRDQMVDDVALGRNILAAGYRWRLLDGTAHVSCRMYTGFWESVDGFSKNVFAFFDYHITLYLIAWAWIAIAFLTPPLALYYAAIGAPLTHFPVNLAALAVLESLFLWHVAYRRFRLPGALIFLYPLSITLFILIALRSFVLTLTGRVSWKGRNLERPAMRWL